AERDVANSWFAAGHCLTNAHAEGFHFAGTDKKVDGPHEGSHWIEVAHQDAIRLKSLRADQAAQLVFITGRCEPAAARDHSQDGQVATAQAPNQLNKVLETLVRLKCTRRAHHHGLVGHSPSGT